MKLSIKLRGDLIFLDKPLILGILNLSPDSFYQYFSKQNYLQIATQVEKMALDGAFGIDIGAMSSRPGSSMITSQKEIEFLKPVLPYLIKDFPSLYFSLDTIHGTTARYGLDLGVDIINDISAFNLDKSMLDVVSEYRCVYILMHMLLTPDIMQLNPQYDYIIDDIYYFLSEKLEILYSKNVYDVIIDLGFGFGKSIEDNYHLLMHLSEFHTLKAPILTGISRKSMIYQPLKSSPEEALLGTSVLHYEALKQGTHFLRVHDVAAARDVVTLFELCEQGKKNLG
ncbi:MAG: dihydropteroate synthase [Chitinophagales bacterium]|jgi:dihydropteroate synthase|nr:dihydropteroate synthase [Chitinophagales bacterium]